MKYSISLFFIFFTIGAQSQTVLDEIVAKVDNYIVLKSDIEANYYQALQNGMGNTKNLRCQILSSMLREKLMVARSEIDSVEVTEAEVNSDLNRRMEIILQQYNGSEEMLLQYYGKTAEDLRLELREQIREQLLVQKMQQFLTKDIAVTPSEVRKFFNRIPKDSLPYYDMEVQVGQIVKMAEPGKKQKDEVREKLIEMRRQIVQGEDFADMAIKNSEGPSGPNGGDLGMVQRGSMVAEFEAGALALKPGNVSMPVETKFGFHLIKLEEIRGAEYRARHILLRPKASDKDIEKAENFLDSIKTVIIKDSVSFEYMVRQHSEDPETKGNGGYFMDQRGGARISIKDLDPEIYFVVDTMEVGSISEPIHFQTMDGKDAVRILYYNSFKDPHQANLTDDWQKIQSAALMEKQNKILSKWFNDAKESVFMVVDPQYEQCGILN